ANPASLIGSAAMLLDWLGERRNDERFTRAAATLEDALDRAIASPQWRTRDPGGAPGTEGFGGRVAGPRPGGAGARERARVAGETRLVPARDCGQAVFLPRLRVRIRANRSQNIRASAGRSPSSTRASSNKRCAASRLKAKSSSPNAASATTMSCRGLISKIGFAA